jgi:hypothetical protein
MKFFFLFCLMFSSDCLTYDSTLWACTLITAEGLVGIRVHEAGAEWTGEHTPLASDTQIRVDGHDVGFWIFMACAGWAGILTRGLRAIVA